MLCSILTVCLHGCGGTTLPESVPSERPRLILLLVIDQFVWDYIDRYGDLFDGGLKHLLDEGALYTNAYYRHATTNTGPGHAVVATGRHPSHSGIIDNNWFDRFLGENVRVIDDPLYPPVGGPGDWASPARLDGFTLGDVLKVESPGSRVVAVSKKPRSAIMLAGRRGDAAYWYEQGRLSRRVITSMRRRVGSNAGMRADDPTHGWGGPGHGPKKLSFTKPTPGRTTSLASARRPIARFLTCSRQRQQPTTSIWRTLPSLTR